MQPSTIAKAITAFLMSFVALLAAMGYSSISGWATPGLLEAAGALIGALITGYMTWLIPNKPSA
jgi:hypothetical protein